MSLGDTYHKLIHYYGGLDIGRNLVHGSDSVETADEEIKLFFSGNEIYNYHQEMDSWVIES